jgi:type VI secretion system protein ImpF
MPSNDTERHVQFSVLDRLLDDDPDAKTDEYLTRSKSLRKLRRSIKRDLEFLLNSVRNAAPVPDSYGEVKRSLYQYGLPDLNSITLENPQDEARFLRSLEDTVANFEPRLSRVRVTAYERLTKKKTALVFHIEALLMIDPAPEPISFDTVLEIAKGSYSVKADQDA